MEYRIIVTAAMTRAETIQHAPVGRPWTHATATAWAHQVGRLQPDGTRIAIDRRRGLAAYQPHRRYVVEYGITVRTDR